MKAEVLVEIALLAILTACGVHLAKAIRVLDLRAHAKESRVDAEHNLALRSVAGIDTSGELINRVIPPGTKRFVVFGLRGSTIQEDLNFWNGAAALVPKNSGVRLVGFCDSNICSDAVRRAHQSSTFPVISYGETIGSQAILDADAQGSFMLVDGGLKPLGRIMWRSSDMTPAGIARQVLQ